jgi:hypothetical protein
MPTSSLAGKTWTSAYAPAVALSPQTLTVDERRIVAAWAAECAEHVLVIYEGVVPGDTRVRAAVEQARYFAAGELDVGDAVRHRGGEAGAAAREAPTPAARAAAYAAEQAAAVAHMGAHALGAAGYAAKASTLAAGCDDDTVTRSEACRQMAAMTTPVARAHATLPELREDRSGPLGPGRLSSGHVGDTIRAIQARLSDHQLEIWDASVSTVPGQPSVIWAAANPSTPAMRSSSSRPIWRRRLALSR